ncbi:MAG: lipopolysaccharide biosynthesis protein [Terriglobia bacterium]|jgi:PST family polysaccharide transporter
MSGHKSFLNSIKWSYTANWGEKGFSSLFAVVLAAILGPRDFGVVAIATVYVAFLSMFLDQGFMTALIQRKELEPQHLDAVFWMDQVLSVVLVGASIFFGGWWASRNHAPGAGLIISVLSLCIPIRALASIQNAILQREMDFKSLAIRANISVLASGVIGLGMAFAGLRVWALVGQQISKEFVALVLLWRLSHWRPNFEFSWKHLKELTGFSVSNFVAQLALFAEAQSSSVLLGLLFGPVSVGLYRLADKISNSVVNAATSSVQAVSLPEFSRHQNRPKELRRSVLTCIRLSSAITLPALAGLAAVSRPLMATIGASWLPASGVLKILCALSMALIFAYFTGPLLQALSRPHQLAVLEWARVAVGTGILVLAGVLVRHSDMTRQLMGIALARFATGALLVTPVFLYLLLRLCKISLRELALTVWPSATSAVSVVAALALFESSGWLRSGKPLVLLLAEVALGGAVGIMVLLALETSLRQSVRGMLQRSFGREAISNGLA